MKPLEAGGKRKKSGRPLKKTTNNAKVLIQKYPELGVTNRLEVSLTKTTKDGFIKEMRERMGIDLINKMTTKT